MERKREGVRVCVLIRNMSFMSVVWGITHMGKIKNEHDQWMLIMLQV